MLALFSLHVAGLAGCVTAPKAVRLERLPEVPAGYANVYLMRPPADLGQFVWPAVLLNGQRAAALPSGTFSVVAVKPGNYEVTMEKQQLLSWRWSGKTHISVRAGQTYYLELALEKRELISEISDVFCGPEYGFACHDEVIDYGAIAGTSWSQLCSSVALAEVQGLRYVEPLNARLSSGADRNATMTSHDAPVDACGTGASPERYAAARARCRANAAAIDYPLCDRLTGQDVVRSEAVVAGAQAR